MVIIVAADAMVLKHQVISINNTDSRFLKNNYIKMDACTLSTMICQ